jgi:predicted ester cyclase
LLSVDFVHNGEPRGRVGQRQAVDYFLAAFPDLTNEIELILAEDDLVAAHQRWTGTHEGEFLGVEPSGRRVEFSSTAVLRVRDGLIARAWDEIDAAGILQQLGADG